MAGDLPPGEANTGDPLPLRETFESFYRREFAAMTSLAFAVSGSRLIAEDIAQEAMIKAHGHWDRISSYDNPGTWTRRVTINLASSVLRRRALEIRARIKLGTAGPVPVPEPEDDHVWEAVRSLPRQQRSAIALFYLENRTAREIAHIIGCSEATAKVHLHRGRRALAAALSSERYRDHG